jgi:hypothetical protein
LIWFLVAVVLQIPALAVNPFTAIPSLFVPFAFGVFSLRRKIWWHYQNVEPLDVSVGGNWQTLFGSIFYLQYRLTRIAHKNQEASGVRLPFAASIWQGAWKFATVGAVLFVTLGYGWIFALAFRGAQKDTPNAIGVGVSTPQTATAPTGTASPTPAPQSAVSDAGLKLQVPDLGPFKGKRPCMDTEQKGFNNRIDQDSALAQAEQVLLGSQWSGFSEYLSGTTCTSGGIEQYGGVLVLTEFQPHVGPNVAMEFLDGEHNQLYVFWLQSGGSDATLFASSPPTPDVLTKINEELSETYRSTMTEASRSLQNGVTVVVFSVVDKQGK